MNNERKVAFQEKRIKKLEDELKSYKQESNILEKENLHLKNKISEKENSINLLSQKIDEIMNTYINELDVLKKTKLEYMLLIKEIKKERKIYNGGIYNLLKNI